MKDIYKQNITRYSIDAEHPIQTLKPTILDEQKVLYTVLLYA